MTQIFSSQKRILAVLNNSIPDKVPVCPRLDPKWLQNAGPELAETIIRTTDVALYIDILPDVALFFGQEARDRFRSETRDGLRHEELDTPKGTLTRLIHIETDMMDWAEKNFFDTPEDVEKALSIPYAPAQIDLTEYRHWEQRIGAEGIVLAHVGNALCCPGLWFSPENFVMQACSDATELVLQLAARVNKSIMDVTTQCLDSDIRFFMQSGAELASQTIMGPEWFDRFITPFDKPVAELIRSRGGYTWCHCHGKISAIHKQLADLGIHVLSPCEKPPLQGNIELAELKRSIGGKVCLAGNLDDLALLASGNREQIRAETLACLTAGMPGGGYMLGGTEGCVFSRNTAEAYLYMCELRDQYGKYNSC